MKEGTRRRFLGITGGLGAGATAGCLSAAEEPTDDSGPKEGGPTSDPDNESGSDEFADVDGTVLGEVAIDNLHDEAHTVDVVVEISGETQAWVEKDLQPRTGSIELERTWDATGGRFRVRVRLDGTEFFEVTPEDWNEPDCLSLIIVIDASGELRIAGDATGGFCAQ